MFVSHFFYWANFSPIPNNLLSPEGFLRITVQCAKFHFWVTPDFSGKSGVTFNKKIEIGIGSQNRKWLLQLTERLSF